MGLKTTTIRASAVCPVCEQVFFFDGAVVSNCTSNCSHCGALLLIDDNVVYPFHEKLHKDDPRWPADGTGTGFITIEDGLVVLEEDMPLIPIEGGLRMLPCAPDVCQECAVDHTPDQPHNQQSLYYQYHFYAANHRWPTWADAMAHCSDETKRQWIEQLAKKGITV